MSCNPTTFTPLSPSATDGAGNWDGGSRSVGVHTVDLDDFNDIPPGGVKAVQIRLFATWNASYPQNAAVLARPSGETGAGRAQVVVWHDGDGSNADNTGVVAVDGSNEFEIEVLTQKADTVRVEVVGYYL